MVGLYVMMIKNGWYDIMSVPMKNNWRIDTAKKLGIELDTDGNVVSNEA